MTPRLSLQASRVSADPLPHAALGLDAYVQVSSQTLCSSVQRPVRQYSARNLRVQVTSPIRRYSDLAVHYQIKAFLRGDTLPFPLLADGQSHILTFARDGGVLQRKLERSANEYWLREFLRRCAGQPIEAIVLGQLWTQGMYKLLLLPLGAVIDYKSNTHLTAGDRIEVIPNRNGDLT